MSDFTSNQELIFSSSIYFILMIGLIIMIVRLMIVRLMGKAKTPNKLKQQEKKSKSHHEQLMDRLINYEFSKTPNISKEEARKRAYRRWERDNR